MSWISFRFTSSFSANTPLIYSLSLSLSLPRASEYCILCKKKKKKKNSNRFQYLIPFSYIFQLTSHKFQQTHLPYFHLLKCNWLYLRNATITKYSPSKVPKEEEMRSKSGWKTPNMKPQTHKAELQQRNCLETVSRNIFGLESVLLARNLTLNSDAAANYKYMFGPHWSPHFICDIS